MAVQSTMLPLGTQLPTFALVDAVSGEMFSSSSLSGAPALVTVICNHCPYVVRMKEQLAVLAKGFIARGVNVVAVSANDIVSHPDDGPEQMKSDAQTFSYPFPYLYDAEQNLVAALRAMCTPEFYLFDAQGRLVYRGRLDDSTPGNGKPVTGSELMRAVDALLSGEPPVEPQLPSMGCSVKWKSGSVPDYVRGL